MVMPLSKLRKLERLPTHEDALQAEYLDELTQLSTQPSCAYSFCESCLIASEPRSFTRDPLPLLSLRPPTVVSQNWCVVGHPGAVSRAPTNDDSDLFLAAGRAATQSRIRTTPRTQNCDGSVGCESTSGCRRHESCGCGLTSSRCRSRIACSR